MKKTIFIFTALIVALLGLFKLSSYAYASGDASIEFIIAIVAVSFFFVGIYINHKSLRDTTPSKKDIDHKKIVSLGLSKREYEVLNGIASGLSNKEIGEQLFLSESTIKSHVSKVLVKLNAKRRTQAIQIAKKLQIL